MDTYYTVERNVQIVIALLKHHNIHKIIASPGTTNITLVASLQQDSFFQIYSSVDERSAAYLACGMAEESGEPVVLTCTGATASRNYFPGLTEAYYRKLPILAITSTQFEGRIGHLVAQVINRSVQPKDTCVYSCSLPTINSSDEEWNCVIKANEAFLALKRHGGGPVHINLATTYNLDFSVKELPTCRFIDRIMPQDEFPILSGSKIGVFVGSHSKWRDSEVEALEKFCHAHNAVVLVDHTSNYNGKYSFLFPLVGDQATVSKKYVTFDTLIHVGNVSCISTPIISKQVWRVNPDGEIRDHYRNLRYVFEMSEELFFSHYSEGNGDDSQIETCNRIYDNVYNSIPDIPFSMGYVAKHVSPLIPRNSSVYLGIFNSVRDFNFFKWDESIFGYSNVGGFGIDGDNSSMIGASLANPDRLFFGIIGDLAFFYDMNVIGNRHVGNNVRILLVNNGKGGEFRQYNHPAAIFKDEDADKYIAAAGHYGNQSQNLVRHFAEDLGYEYLTASSKDEFDGLTQVFLNPQITDKPILFEVFTDSHNDSMANKLIRSCNYKDLDASEELKSIKKSAKNMIRGLVGQDGIDTVKKLLGQK